MGLSPQLQGMKSILDTAGLEALCPYSLFPPTSLSSLLQHFKSQIDYPSQKLANKSEKLAAIDIFLFN